MASTVLLRNSTRLPCLHRLSQTRMLNAHPTIRNASSSSHKNRRNLRNDEIQHPFVQLVDPETGRLHPPTPLSDIITSVDLKTHFVELVRAEPRPIVKIMSKKGSYDKQKEQKAAKKTSAAKTEVEWKEIQLSWGVASGDLAHKLKKARQELEKGNRVDLVYAPKRGQPKLSPSEMEARVQETLRLMQDVGREWQPRDVQGAVTAIHLQGTQKAS